MTRSQDGGNILQPIVYGGVGGAAAVVAAPTVAHVVSTNPIVLVFINTLVAALAATLTAALGKLFGKWFKA
jgi:hypothetical protein